MSIFNKVLHLRLRGHVRCVFITAILIMKYTDTSFFFTLLQYGVSLVVNGCSESGRSRNDLSHMQACMAHVKKQERMMFERK